MNLIKLLLIGLLSVGVLLACEGNGTTIPKKRVPVAPLSIVGFNNKLSPELFQNITIKIRAIDKIGNTVKSVTWEAKGFVNAEIGETTDDGITTLKVTSENAKGTITAEAKIGSETLKAEYIIVASEIPLKKLDISPTKPNIAILNGKGYMQFNAVALFGSTRIDVTDDTVWTIDPTSNITINNDDNKGLVTVTENKDNIKVFAEFTSGAVVQLDNTTISSRVATPNAIKITGVQSNSSIINGTVIQLSAMASFEVIDNINLSEVDITKDATWSSTVESVATVGNTTDDKGLLTIVGIEEKTTIKAEAFSKDGTIIVTATAPKDRITAFTVETPIVTPSEGDTEFVININETTIATLSPTPAESKLYTCKVISGTGVVLINNSTTCDKLKTGTSVESLATTIEVTNTIQPTIEAQTVVITPTYENIVTTIESFTVKAPANELLNKPNEKIELIIMEQHDIGNDKKGVLADYTCEVNITGTGVVLEGGTTTGTCDNLKTGTSVDALATEVKIMYTDNAEISNLSGNITITPVYTNAYQQAIIK